MAGPTIADPGLASKVIETVRRNYSLIGMLIFFSLSGLMVAVGCSLHASLRDIDRRIVTLHQDADRFPGRCVRSADRDAR
jgi:hypothetical protein